MQVKVTNAIVMLFQSSVAEMKPGGDLWPLALCLFASFLKDLREFHIKYPQNVAMIRLLEVCRDCKISMNQMLEWGDAVKAKWEADNLEAVVDSGSSLIPVLLEKVVDLQNQLKREQQVLLIHYTPKRSFFFIFSVFLKVTSHLKSIIPRQMRVGLLRCNLCSRQYIRCNIRCKGVFQKCLSWWSASLPVEVNGDALLPLTIEIFLQTKLVCLIFYMFPS